MLESYEAKFAQMNAEIEELQLSLSAFKNVPADDAEARKRLQFLELQVHKFMHICYSMNRRDSKACSHSLKR